MDPWVTILVGAVGGFAGTALRVGLNTVLPPQDCTAPILNSGSSSSNSSSNDAEIRGICQDDDQERKSITLHSFPMTTFLVNVIGSFILCFATVAAQKRKADPWIPVLVGSGFCGGLTTTSGFVLDLLKLSTSQYWATAVFYFFIMQIATVAVGILGWVLGGLVPSV